MDKALEELAPALARWLAPYVAEELRLRGSTPDQRADYDRTVCDEFAAALPISVLNRAEDFFGLLADRGRVDSLEMAQHMSLGSPRFIPGAVTTPIKIRAKKLGLREPWDTDTNSEGRTVWVDRAGIASRMLGALSRAAQDTAR